MQLGQKLLDVGGKVHVLVYEHLKRSSALSVDGIVCTAGALAGEYAYRTLGGGPGPLQWTGDFRPWQLLFDSSAKPGSAMGLTGQFTFAGAVHAVFEHSQLSQIEKLSLNVKFAETLKAAEADIRAKPNPQACLSPTYAAVWTPSLATQLRADADRLAVACGVTVKEMAAACGFGLGSALLAVEDTSPITVCAYTALRVAAVVSMVPPQGAFQPLAQATAPRAGGYGR